MNTKIKTSIDMANTLMFTAPQKLVAANQNSATALKPLIDPQWFDIKHLVECMFDERARLRDAISERREAELVQLRYRGHPGRQLITAEIHGLNMQISLHWHAYRKAVAAYHAAWTTYQANLKRH